MRGRRATFTLGAVAIALAAAPVARAQTVGDLGARGVCTTAGLEGISEQLVETQRCMDPDVFVEVDHPNVRPTSTRVHLLMSRTARDALLNVARRRVVRVTSMYRTVAEQYVLYRGCSVAAPPGGSNHQSGRAIDVSNYGELRSSMQAAGCAWLGSYDAVHFDCPGGDHRPASIRAFQRLWNVNHPDDPIAESGRWDSATATRLRRSPARGFPRTGCAAAGEAPAQSPLAGTMGAPDGITIEGLAETPAGGELSDYHDPPVDAVDAGPGGETTYLEPSRSRAIVGGCSTSHPLRGDASLAITIAALVLLVIRRRARRGRG